MQIYLQAAAQDERISGEIASALELFESPTPNGIVLGDLVCQRER